MFCSSCGATVREGSAFCASCGKPIVGYSAAQASPAVAASGVRSAAGGSGTPIIPGGMAAARDTGLYAGFWLRFVAAIIDGLLIGIPYVFLAIMIFASAIPMIRDLAATENPNPFELIALFAPRFLLFAVLSLLGSWLYWSLLESSSWQATLGKKALGLYVTDLTGARLTFGKASGRFFAGRGIAHVPSIGGLYFLIDCIMAGVTEKKQALHDMIAGCLVQRNV
jgi:uncharacterized RDD family membrane protein YckC